MRPRKPRKSDAPRKSAKKRGKQAPGPQSMRVEILGKRWWLEVVPPERLGVGRSALKRTEHGDCDAPDTRGKRIRIAGGQQQLEELESTLHECFHAADWSKDDEWVQVAAQDIARILWRLGWRKHP